MGRKYICDTYAYALAWACVCVCARVALWSTNRRRNDSAKFMNLYGENVSKKKKRKSCHATHTCSRNVWTNSLHLSTDYALIRSKSICG